MLLENEHAKLECCDVSAVLPRKKDSLSLSCGCLRLSGQWQSLPLQSLVRQGLGRLSAWRILRPSRLGT